MWWVRARAQRDRGAVAVLIAIVLPVVLLGIGALVLDVGSWYAERAQTQNGADAGAYAVAMSCAQGNCDLGAATGYAPANSNGNLDTSAEVSAGFPCGRSTGTPGLPDCPIVEGAGATCPASPPTGNYVNVRTNTLSTKNGSTLVPPLLGRALLGNSYDGAAISACAQAVWGAPSALGDAAPFVISLCEWKKETNNDGGSGGAYATYPPWPPGYLETLAARQAAGYLKPKSTPKSYPSGVTNNAAIAGSETVIVIGGTSSNPCATSPSGQDGPGNFGWLVPTSISGSLCSIAPASGTTVPTSGTNYLGNNGKPPSGCEQNLMNSYQNHTPLYVPVYDSVSGSGSHLYYHAYGFAAFVVTGWGGLKQGNAFADPDEPSLVALSEGWSTSDAEYCGKYTASPNDQCVYGFFTQALIPASALPTGSGPDLGATNVRLSG